MTYALSKEAIFGCEAIYDMFSKAPIPLTLASCHMPDMPLVLINEPFVKMTGYEPSELLGKNCRFLQGKQDNTQARKEIRSAMQEKREITVSLKNERKDGSPLSNSLFMFPIFSHDNQLRFFLGTQFEKGKGYASWQMNLHLDELKNSFTRVSEDLSWEFLEIPPGNHEESDAMPGSFSQSHDRPKLFVSLALKSIAQLQTLNDASH